jgi:hypothetical protein
MLDIISVIFNIMSAISAHNHSNRNNYWRTFSLKGDTLGFCVALLRGVFGKIFFSVAQFLYNFQLLADPTLSGRVSTVRHVHRQTLAGTNLARLE